MLLHTRHCSQTREQGAEFGFRVLVVLGECEREGVLQKDTRGGDISGPQKKFTQQDARHHPVSAGRNAKPVVLDGLGLAFGTGGFERLR